MSAGTDLCSIAGLEQLLHALAVRLQDVPIACLRVRVLAKPPYAINGVLDPFSADRNPFRRGGELRGIMPKEFLRKKKLVRGHPAEFYQQFIVIKASGWLSWVPTATYVDNKATFVLEEPVKNAAEFQEPRHILCCLNIPILLFPS
jgi:hypothetical protein